MAAEGASGARGIPAATIARLPVYQRILGQLRRDNIATVSSAELAELTGVTSAKVRKDLSHLGSYGVRGVGYDVAYLDYQISRGLGLTNDARVLIVGAGNVGRALASYAGFTGRGFHVVALVDTAPTLIGQRIGPFGIQVEDAAGLARIVARTGADIGVVATPAHAAQGVCDRLVAAGVRGILSFAPSLLNAPAEVEVRKVDLGLELQILAFHAQRSSPRERSLGTGAGAAAAAAPLDLRPVQPRSEVPA